MVDILRRATESSEPYVITALVTSAPRPIPVELEKQNWSPGPYDDHLIEELGWTLRSVPVPPKGQHWRLLSSVKELDPAWVRYLGEGAA